MAAGTTTSRALLLALAVLLALPLAAAAQDGPQVTRSVQATDDDLAPTRTYSSPFVLIAPDDPLTVLASTVEMRDRTCHMLRSRDGGVNWTLLDESPTHPDYPFCFQTSGMTTLSPMAFGRNGTLYLGMSAWGTQDETGDTSTGHGGTRGNLGVQVARTDDLGDTWDTVLAHDVRGNTGEDVENNRPVSTLAVDTSTGSQDSVYVAWRRNLPNAEDAPAVPMAAVSTDGGRTFAEPVNLFGDYDRETPEGTLGISFGAMPSLAVGDDGTAYALFGASGPGAPTSLLLSRSTDQGQTWSATPVFEEVSGSFAYPVMRWSPHGGDQGTLHLIYEDKPDGPLGDRDVYYTNSTDGGDSWREPVMLNDDDPAQLYGQYNASLSIADNGRVDAAWWDFRDGMDRFANDVYYAYSTDNGATWSSNIRVSDRSISRRIGTWSNGFDMRQPPGVASHDTYAVFGWDDTRLGDQVGQAQDVFAASAQFAPIPAAADNTLWYAAAGLAGLVVAGLVLVFMGLRLRGTPPEPQRKKEREPVGV